MTSEADRERAFAEALDRLLAGGPAAPDTEADDDFRSALDFARRMAAARPMPNATFRAELRARLLSRLDEAAERRRVEAARGWLPQRWAQELRRRPAWAAAATGLLLLATVAVVWAAGLFSPASQAPPGTVLAVSAASDRSVYPAGQVVEIEVSLENVTEEPFTVEEFPPMLSLMREGTGEPVYTFGAGSTALTLAPGQKTDFTVRWDQRDARGGGAGAGRYYVELEDIESRGQTVKLTLARPVQFEVRAAD